MQTANQGGEIKHPQYGLPVTGIVLAGGRGLRLGRPKALEKMCPGDTLLGRAINGVRPLCAEVIVVTRPEQCQAIEMAGFPAHVASDIYPDRGPLGGIYTGLKLATTGHGLAVACDMPFLSTDLLRYLISLAHGCDIVAPVVRGLTEQLHNVYSRDCLPAIESLLAAGRTRVAELLPMVKVRFVSEEEMRPFDPDLRSFFNINTEADLRQARGIAGCADAAGGSGRKVAA